MLLAYFHWFFFLPGRGFDHKGDLKPDGQEILLMALTSLEDAMCTLKDGTIQYQLLMLIKDNFDRFLMLCQEMDKEGHENVRQSLNQRLAELRAFEVEREQVIGLLGMCTLFKGGNSHQLVTGYTSAIVQNVIFWSRLRKTWLS